MDAQAGLRLSALSFLTLLSLFLLLAKASNHRQATWDCENIL